jgi:hypothetical protein
MKISEIISPTSDLAPPNFDQIDAECSQYLRVVARAKEWLYRGTRATVPWYEDTSRLREPVDSDPQAVKIFDQLLTRMGHEALRSNSVFTTSLEFKAASYGVGGGVYVIIPKNGCDYTWTKQKDLILRMPDLPLDAEKKAAWFSQVQAWVLDHPNPEFKWVLGANAEIVIQIMQDDDEELTQALPPELWIDAEKMVSVEAMREKYEPQSQKTGDLAQAINDGVEVMIRGSYYALNVVNYSSEIHSIWQVPVRKVAI